ncbi:MAG: DUF6930 domain-containing protein [Kiritimatiellia bacterium]
MPKILSPDLEMPSAELRKEAYELALSIWDMMPWVDFVEEQVLSIRFADGAERFLSVLGSHGEYRALAFYPDAASYWRIRGADEDEQVDLMEAFMSTAQLQLFFCKSPELLRGERAAIKASGVKFPRGVNPSFVSYIPGFAPDAMGAGEMRETLRFIKAFCGFRKDHMANEVRSIARPFDLYTTWAEDAKGCWTKGENDFSPMLPVVATLDQNLVGQVAALQVKQKLFLEIGVFPVPAGRTPSGRGKMSKFVLLADGPTQFVLGTDIVETPDDRETDWTPIVESVFKTLCKFGMRPKHFASTSRQMEAILNGLCATSFKGSKVVERASCASAKAAYSEISARLFGR